MRKQHPRTKMEEEPWPSSRRNAGRRPYLHRLACMPALVGLFGFSLFLFFFHVLLLFSFFLLRSVTLHIHLHFRHDGSCPTRPWRRIKRPSGLKKAKQTEPAQDISATPAGASDLFSPRARLNAGPVQKSPLRSGPRVFAGPLLYAREAGTHAMLPFSRAKEHNLRSTAAIRSSRHARPHLAVQTLGSHTGHARIRRVRGGAFS